MQNDRCILHRLSSISTFFFCILTLQDKFGISAISENAIPLKQLHQLYKCMYMHICRYIYWYIKFKFSCDTCNTEMHLNISNSSRWYDLAINFKLHGIRPVSKKKIIYILKTNWCVGLICLQFLLFLFYQLFPLFL